MKILFFFGQNSVYENTFTEDLPEPKKSVIISAPQHRICISAGSKSDLVSEKKDPGSKFDMDSPYT